MICSSPPLFALAFFSSEQSFCLLCLFLATHYFRIPLYLISSISYKKAQDSKIGDCIQTRPDFTSLILLIAVRIESNMSRRLSEIVTSGIRALSISSCCDGESDSSSDGGGPGRQDPANPASASTAA